MSDPEICACAGCADEEPCTNPAGGDDQCEHPAICCNCQDDC